MPTSQDEYIQCWLHCIGQRIQTAREAAGMSRTQLAQRMHCARAALSRIEQGTHGRAPLHLVYFIASELGLRFEDLMARPEDAPDVSLPDLDNA